MDSDKEGGIYQGPASEYKAIFYKTAKFNNVSSGTFRLRYTPKTWYSDTWHWGEEDATTSCDPDRSSGSKLENDKGRTCTWAILEDKTCGRRVFVLNTHNPKTVDTGDVIRIWTKCSARIVEMVDALNTNDYPVIIAGDVNVDSGDSKLT